MGKIRSWQNTLPYLSDKARNLELAGTPRNNKRPSCREEELISALHQLPPPPHPPKRKRTRRVLIIISCLPFLLLSTLTHNNNNNNNNNIYPWSPLALAVFSGAHADVTLWDICEATPDTSGAFLWDDPNQDQWFEITRIMVDQSTLDKDSSVHLIYHDPNDLGSLILIRIISKERTLRLLILLTMTK